MANGNGIPKWVGTTLIVMIWGALAGVITFMGGTVRANDNKATQEHKEIRKEIVIGDEKVLSKIEKKIDKIEDKMDGFILKQTTLAANSNNILTMVKYLTEKME